MVVKFWANKGLSAIDYLLNNRVEQGTSKVLSGNEMLTRKIIENMTQQNKATVGVLSFHKNDRLNEKQKQEIMESFENAIFSGIPKDQTNILWVEHTDKNRIELNFVIPKINLVTQKSVNWSFDRLDRDFFNSWRDLINHQYNLEKPNDPIKKRNFKHSKNLELNIMYEEINSTLHEMVADGSIRNRDELLTVLKKAGYEIKRQGQDYISIQSKNMKKAKRFTGAIYESRFTEPKDITRAIQKYEESRISEAKNGSSISSRNELEQRFERLQKNRQRRFIQARTRIKKCAESSRDERRIYKLCDSNIGQSFSKRGENKEIRAENRKNRKSNNDDNDDNQIWNIWDIINDNNNNNSGRSNVYFNEQRHDNNIHERLSEIFINSAFSSEEETREFMKIILPNQQDIELNKKNIEELETFLDKCIDDYIEQRNKQDEIHDRDMNVDATIKNCGGSSKGIINPKNKLRLYYAMKEEVARHNTIQEKINLEQTRKIKRGF